MSLIGKLISAYVRFGPNKGKPRLTRALIPLAGPGPIRSRYGVLIAPTPGDATSAWSISGGVYDDVWQAVRHLRPGMCFLDIGANVGVFSMIAAKLVGDDGCVVAFEPVPAVFERLVASAKANNLSNFFPLQIALGDRTGRERFSAGPATHTGTGHLDSLGNIAVLQATYDDLEPLLSPIISRREIMIKIDVEGAECLVIRSLERLLSSGRVGAVVVEIDHAYLARFDTTALEIYARMEAAGFVGTSSTQSKHYNEIFIRPIV